MPGFLHQTADICVQMNIHWAAAGAVLEKNRPTCSLNPESDLMRLKCTPRVNPWRPDLFTRPSSKPFLMGEPWTSSISLTGVPETTVE